MASRVGFDDAPAADGHARRRQAHDEQVAARQRDLVLQAQLDPGLLAGQQLVAIEQRHLAERLRGAGVKADLGVVANRRARP